MLLNTSQTNAQVNKQLMISGGVGFSNMYLLLNASSFSFASGYLVNDVSTFYGASLHRHPAFNAMAEYGLGNKNSLGLAFSCQELNNYPYTYIYFADIIPANSVEKIIRINVGIRYLHYIKGKGTFYYGFRLGRSFWKDIIPPGMEPRFTLLGTTGFAVYSFQALFGYRYYFTYNWAINAELAAGSPYYANIGITCRIGKQETTKD